jgi:hypothetical protein
MASLRSIPCEEKLARNKSTRIFLRGEKEEVPSVRKVIFVFFDVLLSNRTWYPTMSPSSTPISSETLSATLIAAILLGCVTAIPQFPKFT